MVFPVVGYINFRRQKGSSTFPISLFCKSSLGFVVGECVLTFREFFLTELVNPLNSSFNTLKWILEGVLNKVRDDDDSSGPLCR